ncbi:hypothetical protein [Halococcoides cellulosivorans]|uniref:hypothetical protein n=1 Tax=Halococcoides cellulosivorans TaxID=1679096 RepID=UPI00131F145D|nr:hypothetical protein [Halococcoides cellulosivorans]
MSWREEMTPAVGDRREWLLRLFYAREHDETAKEICGRTRLMKGAFLIAKKLEGEFDIATDFDFEPDKYGPFDQGVFETIEELEKEGLLVIENRPEFEGDCHKLTPEGEKVAESHFQEIEDSQQSLLTWVRERHLDRPLPQILSFVYNQYPKMAKNSEYSRV